MAGLAGAVTAVVGFAVPVQAAPAAPSVSAARVAAAVENANSKSTAQAGYEVGTPPASSAVSDTFTVPTLTCTSTLTGIGPGAYIFTSAGSTSAATVFSVCDGGSPLYLGYVIVDGTATQTSFTPAAGDAMTATVTETASGSKATLRDATQKVSKSVSDKTGGTPSLVLAGVDSLVSGGNQLPAPNFGKEAFKSASADGGTLKAAGAIAVNMVPGKGAPKITTGKLNAAGNAFTETYVA
jgi:hypothetical protein